MRGPGALQLHPAEPWITRPCQPQRALGRLRCCEALARSARDLGKPPWEEVAGGVKAFKDCDCMLCLTWFNLPQATPKKPYLPLGGDDGWRLMLGVGAEADIVTYTSCIDACSDGFWTLSLQLLKQLESDRLQGSAFTYSAAIKGCHWIMALEFLEQIDRKQIPSNLVVYNTAMNVCAKGAQWRAVLYQLQALPSRRFRADVVAYSTAMHAAVRASAWHHAIAVFQELSESKASRGQEGDTLLILCGCCGSWVPEFFSPTWGPNHKNLNTKLKWFEGYYYWKECLAPDDLKATWWWWIWCWQPTNREASGRWGVFGNRCPSKRFRFWDEGTWVWIEKAPLGAVGPHGPLYHLTTLMTPLCSVGLPSTCLYIYHLHSLPLKAVLSCEGGIILYPNSHRQSIWDKTCLRVFG